MYVLFFLSLHSLLLTTFAWKIASSVFKKFICSRCCYFFFFALELIILFVQLQQDAVKMTVAAAQRRTHGQRRVLRRKAGCQHRNQAGSCQHLASMLPHSECHSWASFPQPSPFCIPRRHQRAQKSRLRAPSLGNAAPRLPVLPGPHRPAVSYPGMSSSGHTACFGPLGLWYMNNTPACTTLAPGAAHTTNKQGWTMESTGICLLNSSLSVSAGL